MLNNIIRVIRKFNADIDLQRLILIIKIIVKIHVIYIRKKLTYCWNYFIVMGTSFWKGLLWWLPLEGNDVIFLN